MPRGDGTGPRGFGPMTGRATGFCTGFGAPGFANFFPGGFCRARDRGRTGRGRGFRNWRYGTGLTDWQGTGGYGPSSFPYAGPAMNKQQEVNELKAQITYLEDILEGIRLQLKELEGRQKGSQVN